MITSDGLTIEQILAADDRPVSSVECPEWGGRVYVRPMSGAKRGELSERQSNAEDAQDFQVWLFAAGACDKDGNPLVVSEKQLADLAEKNAAPLERVAERVLAISGIGDTEETEKNSESIPSESPG